MKIENCNTWSRFIDEKCVQLARLEFLGTGKYAFETSLFGEKPFELNMNMPLFDSECDAVDWINNTGKWKISS